MRRGTVVAVGALLLRRENVQLSYASRRQPHFQLTVGPVDADLVGSSEPEVAR